MLDPKNIVNMTCGVVADPEVINDNIIKLRVAVDYAGQEKDSDNKSGYFDVVFYLDDSNSSTKFMRSQIVTDQKMKKGSQIQLVGSLRHRRWTQEDGSKRSAVSIQAESITYARNASAPAAATDSSEEEKQLVEVPEEF